MDIAVCDDNTLFLKEIEEQLNSLQVAENISMFADLDSFLFSIDGGKRYDAVLMDIDWNKETTGMDAATELYRLCPETKIIYVTGFVERFSQHIFLNRANLSGLLTKPVDKGLLLANLQKIADAMPFQEQPALVLRRHGETVSVPTREIYYVESDRHIVHVHTSGETVNAYEQLETIMLSLPGNFFQCHKSYIVNMSHISYIHSSTILLKNGESVPVSRARYAETKEIYFNFMGQRF